MQLDVIQPVSIAMDRPNHIDLLRFRPLRAMILWRGSPYVFQALALVAFLALAVIGWGQFAPAGAQPKTFAKTNLVTLLVWGLWWPAMVWVAVLFGRVWCAVCPLELVSNLSERLGRAVGLPQARVGRWLAGGAMIVVLYALTQMSVAGAQLHRTPAYTAIFLIVLLALAAGTGLVLKDRAFCRAFCPVGMLLAVYGRGGMLAVRPRDGAACGSCAGKECVRHARRSRGDARSCPSLLNVPKLNSNQDCLICTQCIKSCEPEHQNMALLLRRPFHPVDDRQALASWPVTLFIMLVSGFVTWELTTEWKAAEALFLTAPKWLHAQIGIAGLNGYINGLWALLIVPLVLWTVAALAARLLGERAELTQIWRGMAMPLAVVIAAGHMAKGLAKFMSWAPFLPHAITDPDGTRTVAALGNKTLGAPGSLLSFPVVATVCLILLLVACVYAVREVRLTRNGRGPSISRLATVLMPAALFVLIVAGWLTQ